MLVVDDDPLVRDVVAAILESDGYIVDQAKSGPEGIRMASRQAYDLAVVDYEMPEKDGLAVLHELRQLQPDCQRILCSGNLNVPVIMEAVNRGEISKVLSKPVTPETLIDLVHQSLASRDRSHATDEARKESQRRAWGQELEECFAGNHLTMALQPICRPDGSVAAFEGLLRSDHPNLDNPGAVLHAAEELDQLGDLAEVVAGLAVDRLRQVEGDWRMFINAHPRELSEPELLVRRLEYMTDWRHRLVVEITERTYVLELTEWARSIKMLTDAGFSLAVDDLGSGYNSLVVLAELQPEYLKVDMSMTRGVNADPRKQRLIEMLVRFAESTDATVIAEGIETEAEYRALVNCGVHYMQGYYFGRPATDLEVARRQLAASNLPLADAG